MLWHQWTRYFCRSLSLWNDLRKSKRYGFVGLQGALGLPLRFDGRLRQWSRVPERLVFMKLRTEDHTVVGEKIPGGGRRALTLKARVRAEIIVFYLVVAS